MCEVPSGCRSVVGLGRMERLVQITSTLETTSNDAGDEGPMYLSLDGAALDNLEVGSFAVLSLQAPNTDSQQ